MPDFIITLEQGNKRETVIASGETPLDAIFSCEKVKGKLVISCFPKVN